MRIVAFPVTYFFRRIKKKERGGERCTARVLTEENDFLVDNDWEKRENGKNRKWWRDAIFMADRPVLSSNRPEGKVWVAQLENKHKVTHTWWINAQRQNWETAATSSSGFSSPPPVTDSSAMLLWGCRFEGFFRRMEPRDTSVMLWIWRDNSAVRPIQTATYWCLLE